MKYRDINIDFKVEAVTFNMMSVSLEKLDYPMPMHAHSKNSYEIHYVSFGEGTLNTDGGSFEITPGSLYVTGPEIMHEQISKADNPMTEYGVYVKTQNVTGAVLKESRFMRTFFENPFWIGRADNAIHEVMKEIIGELEERKAGYELVLKTLFEKLIILLVRKYDAENGGEKVTGYSSNAGNLMYLIIEEAFLYDYKDITLEKLSGLLKMSERQTERLLKMHYNRTFLQKKTDARMSAAVNMLRQTNKPVSEIAYETGYSTSEHFSAAIKKYSGKTASQIRKERDY